MSKSVRERHTKLAQELQSEWLKFDDDLFAFFERVVAPRLATPALLECGEACIAWSKVNGLATGPVSARVDNAGRALLAELEGKPVVLPGVYHGTNVVPVVEPTPSTAEVDRALVDYLLSKYRVDENYWGPETLPYIAACRKAREKKPRWVALRAGTRDMWFVDRCDKGGHGGTWTEAQARAVADALNALEAK